MSQIENASLEELLKKARENSVGSHWSSDSYNREISTQIMNLKKSLDEIPNNIVHKKGLFTVFNTTGRNPPIAWSFNGWSEAFILANRLGPDQPLIAMRSLNKYISDNNPMTFELLIGLTEIYAQNYLSYLGDKISIIGGNCQSGVIAEALAHHLTVNIEQPPVLVTLDHQIFYNYPGQVVMLFGDKSAEFNPFLKGQDPASNWQEKHGRVSWGFLNGMHGKYFVDPALSELASHLKFIVASIAEESSCPTGNISPKVQIVYEENSQSVFKIRTAKIRPSSVISKMYNLCSSIKSKLT
jgi:hypothetical protein